MTPLRRFFNNPTVPSDPTGGHQRPPPARGGMVAKCGKSRTNMGGLWSILEKDATNRPHRKLTIRFPYTP